MSYPTARIADFAKIKGGKRLPAGANLLTTKTAHPYIRGQDVRDGKITFENPVFISPEIHEKLKRYTVRSGDVCITIVGNIGDVGITPLWLDGANLTENAVKLVDLRHDCTAKYLSYALLSPWVQSQMKLSAAGAAQPKLGIYKVSEIEIPLPPLSTQHRIASILSAYDDLIENNTRRIAILEEMARRIYEEWFVRFRFPGHEQVRMVETELGLIPEGWSVERVANVLQRLTSGTTYKKEQVQESGSVMVVDQSTLDHLGFHDMAVDHSASVENPIAIFGDHTCKLRLMVRPFSIGPNTIPFVGAKDLDTSYVFQLVQGLVATHEYKRHWTDFTDKKVIKCPQILAAAYGGKVRDLIHLVFVLTQKNQNLRTTRDLLLPRLISGELDVSNLPEPESIAA